MRHATISEKTNLGLAPILKQLIMPPTQAARQTLETPPNYEKRTVISLSFLLRHMKNRLLKHSNGPAMIELAELDLVFFDRYL